MGGKFTDTLRREYFRRRGIPTEQLELFAPEEQTMGKLDDFFDMAEGAMDTLEGALKQPEPDKEEPDDVHRVWEDSWTDKEVGWAVVLKGKLGEAYHGFHKNQAPDTRKAVCGTSFNLADVGEPKPLEHGKRIIACSSCIIVVAK